jgi:hypothetical protein
LPDDPFARAELTAMREELVAAIDLAAAKLKVGIALSNCRVAFFRRERRWIDVGVGTPAETSGTGRGRL